MTYTQLLQDRKKSKHIPVVYSIRDPKHNRILFQRLYDGTWRDGRGEVIKNHEDLKILEADYQNVRALLTS